MPLVPFEPFRQLDNFRRELDRFFNNDAALFQTGTLGFGNFNVDVYETEGEVVARCDIPGLQKREDVSIAIDNNVLSINGSVHRVNEVRAENMHRQERFTGRFQRAVALPASVSPEGVKATYKNGVLEVRMKKSPVNSQRRIDVEFY
ncbi:Hsp20/alpha crystallin family protein [Paenibacillus xerothermodurans]|uniref:Hsp20/alpha crystallin family protein n=1 Tax=Paenibacillus xerothermodurans TaxID=1977292 RepID=A0A2W1NBN6_PAEXE|nr:Hsp20/alpha crystallin family protein [Paenibacillus xerothermodurans]PZE21847.1 Hsp20/alpha crystallin family protein [Paenibacillus xerothermodurans]